MRGGCRRGGSLRTLAWRAAQMEGPGCLRTTGSGVRLAPFGGSCPLGGQLRPGRSLVKAGSSAALRARGGEGHARSWGSPGSDPEPRPGFLACWPARTTCIGSHPWKSDCEPGAATVTSLDAQGGADIRLRGPFARRQGSRRAYCPPWVRGPRAATTKWAAQVSPGPSRLSHQARTQARTPGPRRARASRRAPPESIFFPSLGARGSRLHLNEELGARGDLHVSGRPEMEPPRTRSSRRPRPRSPLHLFILLNKNINRVRRAPKRGGGQGEAQLDRCEHLAAASISLKMAPLLSFPLPSPFFALPLTSRVGAPASYPARPFLAPVPTWGAPATPQSKPRDQS